MRDQKTVKKARKKTWTIVLRLTDSAPEQNDGSRYLRRRDVLRLMQHATHLGRGMHTGLIEIVFCERASLADMRRGRVK